MAVSCARATRRASKERPGHQQFVAPHLPALGAFSSSASRVGVADRLRASQYAIPSRRGGKTKLDYSVEEVSISSEWGGTSYNGLVKTFHGMNRGNGAGDATENGAGGHGDDRKMSKTKKKRHRVANRKKNIEISSVEEDGWFGDTGSIDNMQHVSVDGGDVSVDGFHSVSEVYAGLQSVSVGLSDAERYNEAHRFGVAGHHADHSRSYDSVDLASHTVGGGREQQYYAQNSASSSNFHTSKALTSQEWFGAGSSSKQELEGRGTRGRNRIGSKRGSVPIHNLAATVNASKQLRTTQQRFTTDLIDVRRRRKAMDKRLEEDAERRRRHRRKSSPPIRGRNHENNSTNAEKRIRWGPNQQGVTGLEPRRSYSTSTFDTRDCNDFVPGEDGDFYDGSKEFYDGSKDFFDGSKEFYDGSKSTFLQGGASHELYTDGSQPFRVGDENSDEFDSEDSESWVSVEDGAENNNSSFVEKDGKASKKRETNGDKECVELMQNPFDERPQYSPDRWYATRGRYPISAHFNEHLCRAALRDAAKVHRRMGATNPEKGFSLVHSIDFGRHNESMASTSRSRSTLHNKSRTADSWRTRGGRDRLIPSGGCGRVGKRLSDILAADCNGIGAGASTGDFGTGASYYSCTDDEDMEHGHRIGNAKSASNHIHRDTIEHSKQWYTTSNSSRGGAYPMAGADFSEDLLQTPPDNFEYNHAFGRSATASRALSISLRERRNYDQNRSNSADHQTATAKRSPIASGRGNSRGHRLPSLSERSRALNDGIPSSPTIRHVVDIRMSNFAKYPRSPPGVNHGAVSHLPPIGGTMIRASSVGFVEETEERAKSTSEAHASDTASISDPAIAEDQVTLENDKDLSTADETRRSSHRGVSSDKVSQIQYKTTSVVLVEDKSALKNEAAVETYMPSPNPKGNCKVEPNFGSFSPVSPDVPGGVSPDPASRPYLLGLPTNVNASPATVGFGTLARSGTGENASSPSKTSPEKRTASKKKPGKLAGPNSHKGMHSHSMWGLQIQKVEKALSRSTELSKNLETELVAGTVGPAPGLPRSNPQDQQGRRNTFEPHPSRMMHPIPEERNPDSLSRSQSTSPVRIVSKTRISKAAAPLVVQSPPKVVATQAASAAQFEAPSTKFTVGEAAPMINYIKQVESGQAQKAVSCQPVRTPKDGNNREPIEDTHGASVSPRGTIPISVLADTHHTVEQPSTNEITLQSCEEELDSSEEELAPEPQRRMVESSGTILDGSPAPPPALSDESRSDNAMEERQSTDAEAVIDASDGGANAVGASDTGDVPIVSPGDACSTPSVEFPIPQSFWETEPVESPKLTEGTHNLVAFPTKRSSELDDVLLHHLRLMTPVISPSKTPRKSPAKAASKHSSASDEVKNFDHTAGDGDAITKAQEKISCGVSAAMVDGVAAEKKRDQNTDDQQDVAEKALQNLIAQVSPPKKPPKK